MMDKTNEISIEIGEKTITGSYEVSRGIITVNGGILRSVCGAEILSRT
jgi:hypothetical protein